jgi:hypothetical protein
MGVERLNENRDLTVAYFNQTPNTMMTISGVSRRAIMFSGERRRIQTAS